MTVSNNTNHCVACGYQPYQGPDRTGFRGARQSSQSEAAFELTLTTTDGDRVTISASQVNSTESFDYAAVVRKQGQSAIAAQSGYSSLYVINARVSVEGHLDPREIAGIRRLGSLLAKSVRHAGQGNVRQALRTAAKSGGIESIAQFRFDFEKRLEFASQAYQQVANQ
jgi:hypothetical protein